MKDLLSEAALSVTEAKMKNPLALAYVGDTVWDLMVRSRLIYRGRNVRNMHKDAVSSVNAHAQAIAFAWIEALLTEDEADIYRRGRNTHAHHAAPRNQDVGDYRTATGLEALVGYLYLTGQEERLLQLFSISQEETTCPAQK